MAIKGARELAAELAAIRKGKTRSIYLVHGSEAYLVRTASEAIADALAAASGAERSTMDAAGRSPEAVLEPVVTLSLFASATVLLVRNFAHVLTGENAERLLTKLDAGIGDGCAVVFAASGQTPADKIDKRVKGYKGLVKRGVAVELNTQKPDDLQLWLREKAREEGKTLDPDAAMLLIQRVGLDMETLRMELEKVMLYFLNEDRITEQGIAPLVAKSREDAVWDVTDAIGKSDSNRAMQLLDDLFTTGTHPLVVLTLLVRQTRHLLQARLLWEDVGRPGFRDIRGFQSQVASRFERGAFGSGADDVTTIHPFASFKRFEAAKGHEVPELRTLLGRLRRADREAKTGVAAGMEETVEELVLDLCAGGGEAA